MFSKEVSASDAPTGNVPVDVWAKQYETGKPLGGAEVVDLATGDRWKTAKDGYARLSVKPGRVLTLAFHRQNYPKIQTASVAVPPEGLTGASREITLQVPGNFLYRVLRAALGKPEPGKHHIVLTVSAEGKTLHDDAGEGGATVSLRAVEKSVHSAAGAKTAVEAETLAGAKTVAGADTPASAEGPAEGLSAEGLIDAEAPIYLGTVLGKTEWLRPVLTSRISWLKRFARRATSGDGGVIFKNVKPVFKNGAPAEYTIQASKAGPDGKPLTFSVARVMIFPDSPEVINVSPPLGPRVLGK